MEWWCGLSTKSEVRVSRAGSGGSTEEEGKCWGGRGVPTGSTMASGTFASVKLLRITTGCITQHKHWHQPQTHGKGPGGPGWVSIGSCWCMFPPFSGGCQERSAQRTQGGELGAWGAPCGTGSVGASTVFVGHEGKWGYQDHICKCQGQRDRTEGGSGWGPGEPRGRSNGRCITAQSPSLQHPPSSTRPAAPTTYVQRSLAEGGVIPFGNPWWAQAPAA